MAMKPPSLWKWGLIALFIFMIVIPVLKIALALVKGVVALWAPLLFIAILGAIGLGVLGYFDKRR